MSGRDGETRDDTAGGEVQILAEELLAGDRQGPFGPRFFLQQIPAFLRDHCPEPGENLPRLVLSVQGEPLLVCHVVAVAPRWVAVAVRKEHEGGGMRTELVPYETILRVTVGGADPDRRHVGFDADRLPLILAEDGSASAEEALAAAAGRRGIGSGPSEEG